MKRRIFLSGLFAAPVFAASYVLSSRQSDGSLLLSGFKNGYLYDATIKAGLDGSLSKYEVNVTAKRSCTVESLLLAAGLEPIFKAGFSGLDGALLVQLEDAAGDFNLLVDGVLFLNDSAGSKKLLPGQKLTIRALTGSKLVAK
ncbi:MAG: hypothetical protein HY918_02940 [Candidatus Doudnabacteria bacterium]|nr:hypothetical protein [Candidatus Doudnabacteria bacterium]